ncbi:VOC family protein [Smaragdicoccus niigatensis]|uniref:VOC family protein n=1 Tax=Smaragdicoccus niigatensis TaxID=359359 RepID=UPI000475CD78
MTTTRVSSCLIRVSDLDRSMSFYQDVFECRVAIRESDSALLISPDGFQFYLRIANRSAHMQRIEDVGVKQIIWSTDSAAELAQIEERLRSFYPSTYTNTTNGITFVDGIDPDGNRVLITTPTPAQLPREVIDRRMR